MHWLKLNSQPIFPILLLFSFINSAYAFYVHNASHLSIPLLDKCGKRTIWLEVDGVKKCQDGILKLLICYPNHLNSSGTAKASRRFQMMDQGSQEFKECRQNHDEYNGLKITIEKSDNDFVGKVTMEGSTGFKISCTLVGGGFSIQLQNKTSYFSLLKQCSGGFNCEKVQYLGNAFDQSAKESFLDDFDGIWSLGMELLQYEQKGNNNRKKESIAYYSNCDALTINFTDSAEANSCIKKTTSPVRSSPPTLLPSTIHSSPREHTPSTPATSSPSSVLSSLAPTARPSSVQPLEKNDSDLWGPINNNTMNSNDTVKLWWPEFKFFFNAYELGCNVPKMDKEERNLGKRMREARARGNLTREERNKMKIERKKIRDRNCRHAQAAAEDGDDQDCNSWNSATFAVCYKGLLDPSEKWIPRLSLSNLPNNAIAEFCQQKQKEKGRKLDGIHGISVGACSRRVNFTKIDGGTRYKVGYRVHYNITLSFSEQKYYLTKEFLVTGPVNKDTTLGFMDYNHQLSNDFLVIRVGKNNSIFTVLVDPNDKEHDFAGHIEAALASDRVANFDELAQNTDALGFLGRDIFSQDGNVTNWRHNNLQYYFTGNKGCGQGIMLHLNRETERKKLNCYVRPITYCDLVGGREEFDRLAKGKRDLEQLERDCQCPEDIDEFPPRPTNISSKRFTPKNVANKNIDTTTHTSRMPKSWRRKRSLSATNKHHKLFPECENTKNKDIVVRGYYRLTRELLEQMMTKQRKCCKNNTEKNMMGYKRQKRQFSPGSQWEMPIHYCFGPTHDDEEQWMNNITLGLDHIEELTCVDFDHINCDEAMEQNIAHLEFVYDDGCASDLGFLNQPSQPVSIGSECYVAMPILHMELPYIVAHEVLHALGILHEQSRADRNEYVWVAKRSHNYRRVKSSEQRNLPYDFSSLMHYEAFEANQILTGLYNEYAIISLEEAFQQSMQRTQLSFKDAKLINHVYCTTDYPYYNKDSPKFCQIGIPNCTNGGYPDPLQNCEYCRCPPGLDGAQCTELEKSDEGCNGPFELIATSKSQFLEHHASAKKCTWRIIKHPSKAEHMKTRITVEFIEMGFQCEEPCNEWLEIKYKTDKTANGAHICCKFVDDKMPVVTAEDNDSEVLLMLYDPMKRASFKLDYKAEPPLVKSGKKCKGIDNFDPSPIRQPGGRYVCLDNNDKIIDCAEEQGPYIDFKCPWSVRMMINGVEFQRDHDCIFGQEDVKKCRKCTPEVIKKEPDCEEMTSFSCLQSEDGIYNWYWENAEGDYIRLTELACRVKEEEEDAKKKHQI